MWQYKIGLNTGFTFTLLVEYTSAHEGLDHWFAGLLLGD